VADRLRQFADYCPIEVKRLALNMSQINILNPPENPAKMTDSRAKDYVAKFGESSWELDAVEPGAMAQMVRDAVDEVRQEDVWAETLQRENEEKNQLLMLSKNVDNREAFKSTKGKKKKK
jgi:hypothetical protein